MELSVPKHAVPRDPLDYDDNDVRIILYAYEFLRLGRAVVIF